MSQSVYTIINISDITDAMIEQCVQTSRETLRLSNDGTKALLKWTGEKPNALGPCVAYSHDEIMALLSTDGWHKDDIER